MFIARAARPCEARDATIPGRVMRMPEAMPKAKKQMSKKEEKEVEEPMK